MSETKEPMVLGAVGSEEKSSRIEAAIHAHLDAIAAKHEEKILGSVADMIARHEKIDRSRVPDLVTRGGETVVQTQSPLWDPYYRRLPEDVRPFRTPDTDHWNATWLQALRQGNHVGMMEAEAKLRALHPRLYERAPTLEGAASGVGGFGGGTGAYLLPRVLESLVAINLAKIAKMARWARTYMMTTQEHNIPTAGAATSYMQDEATTPTSGEPPIAQVSLVAYNAIGKLVLGNDLLADQAANVVPVFTELMGESLAALEDSEFLRAGTGAAPHVVKLAGQAYAESVSGSLGFGDVRNMYLLVPYRYRDNARWLVSSNVLGMLSGVKDGMGRPLYESLLEPPVMLNDAPGAQGTLMGKPVHEVDLTPGDLYFGDVGRNYAIGRRQGITVEVSKDFYFDTRRTIFLCYQRIAGNNVDTTAGVLCAGITSANSTG